MTHFLRQARHFGNAAGVVGDRTKGVERHDHAGDAEHGRHGDGRAVEARELEGRNDTADDDERRKRRRLKRDRETWMTFVPWPVTEACAIDTHRALARARVIFGDVDDGRRHHEGR